MIVIPQNKLYTKDYFSNCTELFHTFRTAKDKNDVFNNLINITHFTE